MAGNSEKPSGAKDKIEKTILDKTNYGDAFTTLEILAKGDTNIARRIEQITMGHLGGVDIGDVASQVFFDLDNITVEGT